MGLLSRREGRRADEELLKSFKSSSDAAGVPITCEVDVGCVPLT